MERSYSTANYIIMDNEKFIGKNCIALFHNIKLCTVRYYFYNSLVQSIESPSVRGKIGNYITNWLYNPNEQLRNSI